MNEKEVFMPESNGSDFEKWLRKKHPHLNDVSSKRLWHMVEWSDVDEYAKDVIERGFV